MEAIRHLTCEDEHPEAQKAGAFGPGAQSLPPLASHWACGPVDLDLGRTRIMGVVNVTPDSFSDGGLHDTTQAAVGWGLRLLDEGADILDVGGESTRPGFTPVEPEEEAARVVPVIRELAQAGALVSVDTRHALVAQAALSAGARIVNDVDGFTDPAMLGAVVGDGACGCLCMRPRGVSPEPASVLGWLAAQARALERAGVAHDRICLDPGAGFDTDAQQDVLLQRETRAMAHLGYPLVCAVSRKRFVGAVSGVTKAAARDAASTGIAIAGVMRGARIVRVHDVAGTAQAIWSAEAMWGRNAPRKAFIALGANLGEKTHTLTEALEGLGELPLTQLVAASHAYQTQPAYKGNQPAFANAVAEVSTELHPLALLQQLLALEAAHGRVRGEENGPRTLDLDLLWMEGERHAGARLTLPHPLMGERDFVLRPLEDLLGGPREVRAFCEREGIGWRQPEDRVGRVTCDLGSLR